MRFEREAGFTLLETMIAMTIMVLAFSSILMLQSSSIEGTTKAQQLNTVAILARGIMIDTEYLLEGKRFNELRDEEEGNFKEPYQDYRWKRVIKEFKFPTLNLGGAGGAKPDSGTKAEGQDDMGNLMSKLVSNFFSKAMREVTVTVFYKRGSGEQSFSVSTYWVDLNHEFQLSQ